MSAVATGLSESRAPEQVAPGTQPLRACVYEALERYFRDLNGQPPGDLYRLVMSQVEEPLLDVVMKQVRGNQSNAAQLLGINRSTLRKKLRHYNLD